MSLRDLVRLNPYLAKLQYIALNQYCRIAGRLKRLPPIAASSNDSVALCLRFRNEARYLREWIDYYRAAGIAHFFLYNNNSSDDYLRVVDSYRLKRILTLVEWPYVPASPAAEEDCVRRAIGKFAWLGFLDADEFVVIRDGKSIPEFLSEYSHYSGLALHWMYFGSNGHKMRPSLPVIEAYTKRRKTPNVHVKVFIRPEAVTQCANSHSWYFRGGSSAVNEARHPVWGSRSVPAVANHAWINHYYSKSEEDYFEKASQKSTLDYSGMTTPSRASSLMQHHLADNNEVECMSALEYLNTRLSRITENER